MKTAIKRFKKKFEDLDKPMITWSTIAIRTIILIHIIDNGIILILNYENEGYVGMLAYIIASNIIIYKALERLGK